jgi:hypothetical protein
MIKTVFCFVIYAVMVISASQSASACQVDDFYLTKGGALAAFTQETLNAAIRFQEEGNKEKLADFITSGTVLRLTGDSLKQINCNDGGNR